jgi:TRAP-type mannitol/chloroaromatic compound transport system substrate-binding protein
MGKGKKHLIVLGLALTLSIAMVMDGSAQQPAKSGQVYRWQPATWQSAGFWYDHLNYIAGYVDKMSDGQLKMTPSQPGAVCPVSEQTDFVSKGSTPAMAPPSPYLAGKIPVAFAWANPPLVRNVADMVDFLQLYEGGKAGKLYEDAVEKMYNVKIVGHMFGPAELLISSRVPLKSIKDLNGVKFRVGAGMIANTMKTFGTATVFAPGPEIYTMLSTKAIDGVVFGSPYDHVLNSFHEVTKYWVRKPFLNSSHCTTFVVNRDVWNGMPKDLQEMLRVAIDASSHKVASEGYAKIQLAWQEAQKKGVQIIDWSEADQLAWHQRLIEVVEKNSNDPTHQEFVRLLKSWGKSRGLL